MEKPALRFRCTACGACCNRNPEVALSEAANLADQFVFRLMFRIYQTSMTQHAPHGALEKESYFEGKRLMDAFSARRWESKHLMEGKPVKRSNYLMLSALPVDTPMGVCAALVGTMCGIYERRPVACRTVPLHYSRPASAAREVLAAFVAQADYQCDTGPEADVLVANGQIVDAGVRAARLAALRLSEEDRRWSRAIVRRMTGAMARDGSLPTLRQVQENAQFGVTTVSMRIAWQIALDEGRISADELRSLIERQLGLIEREIARAQCSDDEQQTLREMLGEYRDALRGGAANPAWSLSQ